MNFIYFVFGNVFLVIKRNNSYNLIFLALILVEEKLRDYYENLVIFFGDYIILYLLIIFVYLNK